MQEIVLANRRLKLQLTVDETGRTYMQGLTLREQGEDRFTLCEPLEEYKPALVEIHLAGDDIPTHHDCNHFGYVAGNELRYVNHTLTQDGENAVLRLQLKSSRLECTLLLTLKECGVLESKVELTNCSKEAQTVEYVSAFALYHIDACPFAAWDKYLTIAIPDNSWAAECQWKTLTLPQAGLHRCYEMPPKYTAALRDEQFRRLSYKTNTTGHVCISSTGSESSGHTAPCAIIEDSINKASIFFQFNHNGSWQYEITDFKSHLNLTLSGPNFTQGHWYKTLQPGESFESIEAALGLCAGDKYQALQVLTEYRRTLYRSCADIRNLPVIFNDYMNGLMGDPTTEKLKPMADKAREIGAEYFCIDCGWYSDGYWWNNVGEWLPAKERFPGGIKEILDYIKSKGLIPGLWLEIESMGINCPLAAKWPDECFFMLHGRRVVSENRYHLDFRNAMVRAHADSVVDRLVKDYGIGYIKMDYNICTGPGTELDACSPGEGLLQHERAYFAWLDSVFARYPDLVIENCGSGGQRMDYAQLRRHSIQSVTDQTEYRLMSAIACNAASLVTPEQSAIWSYPLRDGDKEETVVNMVNAMLLRIHQSGYINKLSPERVALVKEGIDVYRQIRSDIPRALPYWPLGLATMGDPFMSFALVCPDGRMYLAVFKGDTGTDTVSLPLGRKVSNARILYPSFADNPYSLSADGTQLTVYMPQDFTARLFVLEP